MKVTHKEVADVVGCSWETVRCVRTGKRNPDTKTGRKIVKALELLKAHKEKVAKEEAQYKAEITNKIN